MAEAYGGHIQHAGKAAMPVGSGLGLDGVNVREAIPEIFHGLQDAGIRIAGLGKITVDGDVIRIYVPLDHGVPCDPTPDHPANGGMWIRATKVNIDRGEIRWYVAIDIGDLAHRMYVDTATTGWTQEQKKAALAGLPDVPSSYNDSDVQERLLDTQPDSLREAAKMAAERLGITDGAVDSAVDVTAQHRKRMETAAAARAAAVARTSPTVPDPSPARVDAEQPAEVAPPNDPATAQAARTASKPEADVPGSQAKPRTPPLTTKLTPRNPYLELYYPEVIHLLKRIDDGILTGDAARDAVDTAYRGLAADTPLEVRDLIPFVATGPATQPGATETRLDALAALNDARVALGAIPPTADHHSQADEAGESLDTGHYDDGHSFGWEPPPTPKDWMHLTADQAVLDEVISDIERQMTIDAEERMAEPPKGLSRGVKVGAGAGLLAVLLVAAVAVATRGGSNDESLSASDRSETTSPAPTTTAFKSAVSACELISSDYVGSVVGRPMTSAPATAGLGCKFTATDKPDIDVTTAYPPYISQVVVSYNAPQPGLTEEAIEGIFRTSRPATAVDVSAGSGVSAYSGGGGSVVVLSKGVMVSVSTSGTMRLESVDQVRGWCTAIALALRDKLR